MTSATLILLGLANVLIWYCLATLWIPDLKELRKEWAETRRARRVL